MKITICGSMKFLDKMEEAKAILIKKGHEVRCPKVEIMIPDDVSGISADDPIWPKKGQAMRIRNANIEWSETILVMNCDKNNIVGYIGGNTLIEMGLAFYLNKPIYLFKEIPNVSYKVEILGMKPILINENVGLI